MAHIQNFVANNQRMFKKTFSYYVMHITVAMLVGYFVTGSLWMAITLSLLEPTVQTVAYFIHERMWDQAVAYWNTLHSDADAHFDTVVVLQGEEIEPQVSWGTSPEMVIPVSQAVPTLEQAKDEVQRNDWTRAYQYMGLTAGQALADIQLDRVFIGSCTNSRIEDIRAAADVIKGRKVAPSIKQAMVVPGSGLVKQQAEAEGLDKVFLEAGFEWREPGCSMCLAMNADKLQPGEHCASTSNRNFEGRQGNGGRTHLVSPAMAAAAAIAGHFVDVRSF